METVWYVPAMNLIFVRNGDTFICDYFGVGVQATFYARDVANWDGLILLGDL